jgi:HD-like signal output (HDOD) protein/GGDEF domain-containing protein
MTTVTTIIDRLVDRAGELYSPPTVALRLLDLTRDPSIDARAVKQCLEQDPALAGKVLRTVNSSLFGLRREVADLNQALALLGVKPLKLLVLGFSLPNGLFEDVPARVLQRYWQRALVQAVAARQLSESCWRVPGDEAFLAGLLQDLGQLVLIQQLGAPYIRLLQHGPLSHAELLAAEQRSLGFNHHELSARLLSQWRLPESLARAVLAPECLEQADAPLGATRTLAQIVHLAQLLAQVTVDRDELALDQLLRYARRYRQLTDRQIDDLVSQLDQQVKQLSEVLALDLPGGQDYVSIVCEARQRLVGVAADAAGELVRLRQPAPIDDPVEELATAASRWMPQAKKQSVSVHAGAQGRARPNPTTNASGNASHAARHECEKSFSRELEEDDAPQLLERIASAIQACRNLRRPVSLLLVELTGFDQFVFTFGVARATSLGDLLVEQLTQLEIPGSHWMQLRETRYAAVLPGCERREAVELGHQWTRLVRDVLDGLPGESLPAVALAVGIATLAQPSKDFPAQDLWASASRCLSGALSAGGDSLKSIER